LTKLLPENWNFRNAATGALFRPVKEIIEVNGPMDNEPLGIELSSVPVPVPERGEALMLSLAKTNDDGECLELGVWRKPPPGKDGPELIAPKHPVLLALSELPNLQRLIERAVAAISTAVLDEEGVALLDRAGDLGASLVEHPSGARFVTIGWRDCTAAAFLPVTLAHRLPAMISEASEALAMRPAKLH
jgi:hypothetical protein